MVEDRCKKESFLVAETIVNCCMFTDGGMLGSKYCGNVKVRKPFVLTINIVRSVGFELSKFITPCCF